MSQMQSVMEHFSTESEMSCVMVCLNTWRLDNQAIQTLQHYSQLFKPIFDQGAVVIVRTKFYSDNFDDISKTPKLVDNVYVYSYFARAPFRRALLWT